MRTARQTTSLQRRAPGRCRRARAQGGRGLGGESAGEELGAIALIHHGLRRPSGGEHGDSYRKASPTSFLRTLVGYAHGVEIVEARISARLSTLLSWMQQAEYIAHCIWSGERPHETCSRCPQALISAVGSIARRTRGKKAAQIAADVSTRSFSGGHPECHHRCSAVGLCHDRWHQSPVDRSPSALL
jgi:hypothetical protein